MANGANGELICNMCKNINLTVKADHREARFLTHGFHFPQL